MAGSSSSSNAGAVISFEVVDDFYFSALFEDDEVFPISDEKYSEELQLQEVLVSSMGSLPVRDVVARKEEVLVSSKGSLPVRDAFTREEEPEPPVPANTGKGRFHEVGSSSFFCGICMDRKPSSQVFRTGACSHVFCVDCIGTYVATRIRESITHIECPEDECPAVLEPYICRPIIPAEVFDRWENVLCESLIVGSQKFYCPFADCSSLLIDDGGDIVTVSECPICMRLFCAQCKVAWHSGLTCEGFHCSKEGKANDMELDMLAMKLAESKKWRKCPECNFYVEKIDGCLHITCRCGYHFCYGCGDNWNGEHYDCISDIDSSSQYN